MSPAFKDALGESFSFKQPFNRIVSLIPSTTEILFAVGAGDLIAGVTRFCLHPADGVVGKIKVGGTKNINFERVKEAMPDLIIANTEENSKEDIERLKQDGFCILITHPKSCEDSIEHIRELGALAGREKEAERLAGDQERILRKFSTYRVGKRPSVLYLIWKNPYMTINRDTYVHSLIQSAGGENLAANMPKRYPEVSIERIRELKPDIILLPSEPFHFKESDRDELLMELKSTKIYLVNGEDTCWFGPRMEAGLKLLSGIFTRFSDSDGTSGKLSAD